MSKVKVTGIRAPLKITSERKHRSLIEFQDFYSTGLRVLDESSM